MILRSMSKFCTAVFFLATAVVLPGCAQSLPEPANEAQLVAAIRLDVGDAPCDSDQQCKTLAMGEKDCGGPEYWLAWSTTRSNAKVLQAKSTELAALQQRRNEASGARSNCRFMGDPGSMCVAKRCVLKTPNTAN